MIYKSGFLSEEFPRELSAIEKEWISAALPDNKPGYKDYKDKLFALYAIGKGNLDNFSIVLGKRDELPDADLVFPVFAAGNIEYNYGFVYVTVSGMEEEQAEIEFDINLLPDVELIEIKRWSYSGWKPGMKAPNDNSKAREVKVIGRELILVIAPTHKKIWIYDAKTGINHLIPVTNYYNELMRLLNIKDAATVLDSGKFFINLNTYADKDLAAAFIVYNKRWKKVEIDYSDYKGDRK